MFVLQDEINIGLFFRIKELEEERGRFYRINVSQQLQMDKYKKMVEEARSKLESMEGQLIVVRKVRKNRKQNGRCLQSVLEIESRMLLFNIVI